MAQRLHRFTILLFALLIAGPLFGVVARPILRTPEAAAVSDTAADVWLVTIVGNEAGWVVVDGASQWVEPDCRQTLELDGAGFEVVDWDVLEGTPDLTPALDCEDISTRWFGVGPNFDDVDVAGPADPSSALDGPKLDRGINLAGDLEVSPRGSWGTPIEAGFFPLVAERGFDHVRIPIRWSAYTGPAPEYLIDETFFAEVDRLVDLADRNELGIVLDVHFFEELDADPAGERDHFLAIWEQIADRYRDRPNTVVFELLNEPVGVFDDQPELWNALAAEAVELIRRSNPDRTLIIGPVSWNHANRLPDLQLPDDRNIVATIHTYDPFEFTHQGAVFVDPRPQTGVRWVGAEHGLSFDWIDLSWGVGVTAGTNGVTVRFEDDWTALAMARAQPRTAERVELTVGRNFDGVVLCNFDDAGGLVIEVTLSGRRAVADVSDCGDIRTLAIQSRTSRTVAINRVALCSITCEELIVSNEEAVDQLVTTAADWARDQGVRLYVGEFGTLSPTDDPTDAASRTAWTEAVRASAERNDAGWAYFELNGEFGAWDGTTGQWRAELVDALFD